MRKTWQYPLGRQLLSLAFLVMCTGSVLAPSAARAQQYQSPWQMNSGYGAPHNYGRTGGMDGGVPTGYAPTYQPNYGIPQTSYASDSGFNAAAGGQQYSMQPSPNNVHQASAFEYPGGGSGKGIGGLGPAAMQKLSGDGSYGAPGPFQCNGGSGFFGCDNSCVGSDCRTGALGPFQCNGSNGFFGCDNSCDGSNCRTGALGPFQCNGTAGVFGCNDLSGAGRRPLWFLPALPPWITAFESGAYANDDELLLTLGFNVKVWEGPNWVLGARALATGAGFHNGPEKGGVSVDGWGAIRLETLGVGHLFKVGGLVDHQRDFHRGGFTVSGILFPEVVKMAPTFDLAFGFGSGTDVWQGRFREVANYDAQIRMGFDIHDIVRVGASLQYWQWNNTRVFDRNASSAGGYVQLNLGQWMITGDIQATRDNAQGFVNFVWIPSPHIPRGGPSTFNVASTRYLQKYQSWMLFAPIRDLALRTGEQR